MPCKLKNKVEQIAKVVKYDIQAVKSWIGKSKSVGDLLKDLDK